MARSPERLEFLSDVLSTGLHYHWFEIESLNYDTATAVVRTEDNGTGTRHTIGPDDVARGLRMYAEWMNGKRESMRGAWEKGWETEGEKASPTAYGWQLVKADNTNGDDGDYDVNTADSALQFAVFGYTIYG